jgi:cardiolipin synthase (CMP-forming)
VGDVTTSESSNRIFTIPNVISLLRLACTPWFVWLLVVQHNRLGAAWLLGALGATDWVDGWIARKFSQTSELGKILDPTADRLLFILGIGGIIFSHSAPLWFSILVLFRESLLGISLLVLKSLGMKSFPVLWNGKLATLLLMFSFPLFLLAASQRGTTSLVASLLAWGSGIPGLFYSYQTAYLYIPLMRSAFREGRQERAQNG